MEDRTKSDALLEAADALVRKRLSDNRYSHTVRVADTAERPGILTWLSPAQQALAGTDPATYTREAPGMSRRVRDTGRMNRLAGETSPYLLQHADNPVDWFPWGEQALAKARAEDRPIFLSIGYAACHWCHVMERESFEDAETAAFLNAHFVPVTVDL
jgi:hypothetical protein